MDNNEILEQLANNPELLAELIRDERFADPISTAANDSVIKSRDKALKEKNNWKDKAEALTHLSTDDNPAPSPEAPAKQSKSSEPTPEWLQRMTALENELKASKKRESDSSKSAALTDALGGLQLREGGLGVASKLINVNDFDVQVDGSIRHKDTSMTMSDYVRDEWSKTPEAQLVIDTSANRGAGSAQGRRSGLGSVAKKFSDATFEEKNKYHIEHGQSQYAEWMARG